MVMMGYMIGIGFAVWFIFNLANITTNNIK
jgi:hypothetical protein